MHTDGDSGFNDLYRSGRVTEVACLAHIRRTFVDVQQSQGSAVAEATLRRIAEHKVTRIDELLPWRYAANAA